MKLCSQEASQYWEKRAAFGLPAEQLVRMPCMSAGVRTQLAGEDYQTLLPLEADEIAETVLKRAMTFIEEDFPRLKRKLFGAGSKTICDMYKDGELEFSTREPAVNVYAPDGDFPAHKDHKSITVLIPLSSNDDFIGGGTGFWPQGSEIAWRPSMVLRPEPGTAMLFCGQVQHSGIPIESGERVVFVASFSPHSIEALKYTGTRGRKARRLPRE